MFEVMGIVPLITTLLAVRRGAAKESITFGGRSYTAADLQGASDAPRSVDGAAAGASAAGGTGSPGAVFQMPFQAGLGGKAVDMNELMSEVAKTVAEARAKGTIGPMAITQAGLTGLSGLTAASMGGGQDLVAELERLTTLHQAGNLTDEEFTAAKQNLIKGHS
jgi:hypothetical protein